MAQRKKASAAVTKDEQPETALELTYRLVDLPTSQHRAGLVGLVTLTRYLLTLGVEPAAAAVVRIDPGGATLRFTRAGMVALFDTAYATRMGEQSSDKPYKNKGKEVPALRVVKDDVQDKRGKVATKTRYIYPKPEPSGGFLPLVDPSGGEGLWVKLWRDMLWSVPRGVHATRRPFEARAEGEAVTDGQEAFALLQRSPNKSIELASTYLLGAQANTADNVGFRDTAVRQLLLHFWPFATEIFVPGLATREGKTAFDGYVFAFPDVANLEVYCEQYLEFLRRRASEKLAYLPKAAVVDLPGEAGLRTLSWLRPLIAPRVGSSTTVDLEDVVLAVDTIHARKEGNNVRILSQTRVAPVRAMSDEYQTFVARSLWSHVFRRQCLENLLSDRPWFDGFGRLLSILPSSMTFENRAFQHDVRLVLEDTRMPDNNQDLPTHIYRIAGRYLTRKLREKYGLERKPGANAPPKYWDSKGKLAREALLAMRSRTGDDFIAYVSTTVFSVPQGMSNDSYSVVANALLKETEKFRTLLMLAFSAQMPRQQANSTSD